ncbi:MAG: MBL fold metallo-hydrolase [Myxococcota bacterium]
MGLVTAGPLRLLFDPLLRDFHHGGTFEVRPARILDIDALRPDFVLVSHAHPDHFDVWSLRELAKRDPETVLVTPDELVAQTAARIGFRTIHVLPPSQRVTLECLSLVTTPSIEADEWGVLLANENGRIFHQIDSAASSPTELVDWVQEGLGALGEPSAFEEESAVDSKRPIDLALMAWQPLNEVSAVLGAGTDLSIRRYDEVLRQIALLQPKVVVPSASGVRHRPPFDWLNRHSFPISEARFLRDLDSLVPTVRGLPYRVGDVYRVRPHGVEVGRSPLVEVGVDHEPVYAPTVVPPLADDHANRLVSTEEAGEIAALTRVERWLADELAPALGHAYPHGCFVLSVVGGTTADFTIDVRSGEASMARRRSLEWDVLNAITLSALVGVLEGRLHWGDVLLRGDLRAVSRGYAVDEHGLRRTPHAEIFLYHGLSYRASLRRQVEFMLADADG